MTVSVFLDLDGTLTDPKPGITSAVIHALKALGQNAPDADELEWVIGPPMDSSFAKLGVSDPQMALDLYRAHYTQGGLFDAYVYDGVLEALKDIAGQGWKQYLATAKPHAYALKITEHFGLNRWMAAEFGPELDGTRNDKGELLAYALDGLRQDPSTCVMVGDRGSDLRAARHVGMKFVGVTWGYAQSGELENADAICRDPSHLVSTIAGLGIAQG